MNLLLDMDQIEKVLEELRVIIKSSPALPLAIASGGTGNTVGYIQTGKKEGTTLGNSATCEGLSCESSGTASHAEGQSTIASGSDSHAEGQSTLAGPNHTHAEGLRSIASGDTSHAEGMETISSGSHSHAEGYKSESSGPESHAEGTQTISSALASHAEGWHTEASDRASHAEGQSTRAIGTYSHAEGHTTEAGSNQAHAEGYATIAGGFRSHSEGDNTQALARCQHAGGFFNVATPVNTPMEFQWDHMLIIGNGTSDTARSNMFRVGNAGVFSVGNYNSSGADYAEYFEWVDGNSDKEDRRGRFVNLVGGKIHLSNMNDDTWFGVVSANPSVVGDAYEDQWQGMYETDVFGTFIYEEVEVPNTDDMEPGTHMETHLKLNPAYDPSKPYIPRSKRPEYSPIGFLGKLVMVDDGTCQPDLWVKPSDNGIATVSYEETRCIMLNRIDENHIRVFIRP